MLHINNRPDLSRVNLCGGIFPFNLLVSLGVTITGNASVLVATVSMVAASLALEHLAVLRDAVTLTVGNVAVVGRVSLSGSPGKVVTADLDVVVGELSKLVVIHTEKLGLLSGTELETGDLVDDERKDGAHDESVGGDGNDIDELDVELLPVVLDPATSEKTVVHTIKTNNVVRTEDTVCEKADHTSDTVLSEHVEGIVDLNPVLD